jgi:hypothetical protein
MGGLPRQSNRNSNINREALTRVSCTPDQSPGQSREFRRTLGPNPGRTVNDILHSRGLAQEGNRRDPLNRGPAAHCLTQLWSATGALEGRMEISTSRMRVSALGAERV